jgi:hypothetical protein
MYIFERNCAIKIRLVVKDEEEKEEEHLKIFLLHTVWNNIKKSYRKMRPLILTLFFHQNIFLSLFLLTVVRWRRTWFKRRNWTCVSFDGALLSRLPLTWLGYWGPDWRSGSIRVIKKILKENLAFIVCKLLMLSLMWD